MSIYRDTLIKFGFAAAMLMTAAGGALAQTSYPEDSKAFMAYSAAPADSWAVAHAMNYNLLVGPGITTVGVAPGDRTAPVGAD